MTASKLPGEAGCDGQGVAGSSEDDGQGHSEPPDRGGLEFDGIALRLGGRELLRGVSFAVARGEVVGLLGGNGAGKTTLLRVATRVLQADSGEVRLAGRPVGELSRRELARALAIVPQETHIPFPFTALEIVVMGRAPHQPLFGFESAGDLAVAQHAMERVGVAHLAQRSVLELSGGERQLVMVARALAQEPEFLLLDEPTAFLDLRHRVELLRVLRELASAGCGVLMVSHDLDLVARASDRLVVIGAGVVVVEGEAGEVLGSRALCETFGIEADLVRAPDGSPALVPRIPDSSARMLEPGARKPESGAREPKSGES
jgi:iron complex transport system ATP-binding protein